MGKKFNKNRNIRTACHNSRKNAYPPKSVILAANLRPSINQKRALIETSTLGSRPKTNTIHNRSQNNGIDLFYNLFSSK